MKLTNKELIRYYSKLYKIRETELRIVKEYPNQEMRCPVHLSIGQEAVSVGVCEALAKDDIVSNTYRCHATHIAKGGDLNKMMAELYGKKDGSKILDIGCGKGFMIYDCLLPYNKYIVKGIDDSDYAVKKT